MDSLTQAEVVEEVNIVAEANIAVEASTVAEASTGAEVKEVIEGVTEAEEAEVATMQTETMKKPSAHLLLKTSSSITKLVIRSHVLTNAIEDQGTPTLMTSSTKREEWVTLTK